MKTKQSDFILYIIIITLITAILLGTVFGLAAGHRPAENLRTADPSPKEIPSINKKTTNKVAAYTELGQIRSVTKAENEKSNGITVIITPWLSYPEGDTVFFEELSRKRLIIKGIIQTYFSEYTQKELLEKTEPKIKDELMTRINAQLTLSKISSVYFSEYIFLQ